LYGTTLLDMQLMQVVYALGTAAEDVFSAYIYHVLPPNMYQIGTRYSTILIYSILSCPIQKYIIFTLFKLHSGISAD
jgi:hypothetical protein